MVSKVAVIALVVIVACPILMGYAMNLSEVTVTDYEESNDQVNVTQLLQNSSDYYNVSVDPVYLNTNWFGGTSAEGVRIMPYYTAIGTNKTSVQVSQASFTNSNWIPSDTYIQNFSYFDLLASYDSNSCALNMTIYYNDSTPNSTINKLNSLNWDGVTHVLTYSTYNNGIKTTITNATNIEHISFASTGTYVATTIHHYDNVYWTPSYVNLSAGYILGRRSGAYADLKTPDYTDVVLTMDLNSITDSSYGFQLITSSNANRIGFVKTTDVDGVHWALYRVSAGYPTTKITDLYYNQNASSNTYQIYIDHNGTDFRYVGNWPTIIGVANYYQHFYVEPADGGDNLTTLLSFVRLQGITYTGSPLLRVDKADYLATSYAVIEDQIYEPAAFKNNPATKLGDVTKYGTSIEFGGQTFTVKDGNITIGTHQVPVNNLVLSSTLDENGYYENRIGNTLISVTLSPSTIVLNGKWTANITTSVMEQKTYTKTEWIAGSFAWDGIDQNFKIVGLLASVGAFIAVAIYARTSNKTLWPALIVCGAAAMLFFAML